MSWSSAAHPGDMHGASASTAREPAAYDGLGLASFDPSHLSPTSTWRDLSDGGYSEVYRARMLGAPVAVKQATNRKKTSGDALLREIKYLQLAGAHPNIVSVYGAFSERGKLHLVLEYAVCLRTDRVARACDPILVVSGIARALVRLHGNGIIHRDLKVRKRAFFIFACVLFPSSHMPPLSRTHAGAQRADRARQPADAHRLWPRVPHGPRRTRVDPPDGRHQKVPAT